MIRAQGYGRAFARALCNVAAQQKAIDHVARDMQMLLEQWQTIPELRAFCCHQYQSTQIKREKMVHALWSTSVNPLTLNCLVLLARKKQLHLVPRIGREFEYLADQQRGYNQVRMVFATAPDTAEINKIKELIAGSFGQLMRVTTEVDSKLIAGVQFYINDRRVDASLAGRLERLRAGLLQPVYDDALTENESNTK